MRDLRHCLALSSLLILGACQTDTALESPLDLQKTDQNLPSTVSQTSKHFFGKDRAEPMRVNIPEMVEEGIKAAESTTEGVNGASTSDSNSLDANKTPKTTSSSSTSASAPSQPKGTGTKNETPTDQPANTSTNAADNDSHPKYCEGKTAKNQNTSYACALADATSLQEEKYKTLRNSVVGALISASNVNCAVYLRNLRGDQAYARVISDWVGIGAGGWAQTLKAPSHVKEATVIGTGAVAGGAAFDRDVFANAAIEIVTQSVETTRTNELKEIQGKFNASPSDWPIGLAVSDVLNYHNECDLNHALSHMSSTVQQRETLVQAVRNAVTDVAPSDGAAIVKAVSKMVATSPTVPASSFDGSLFLLVQSHPDDDVQAHASYLKSKLEAAWKTLFPPSYTGEALKTAIKTALSDNISERTTINFVTSWLDSIPGPSYAAFAASFEPATKGKQTKNSPNRANAQASFQKIAEGKLNEQAAAVKAKRLRILTLISSEVTASDLKTLTSALTAAIGGDSNCSTTSGIDPAIIDVCSALTAAQGNSAETAASLSSEILVAIAKQAAVNP